MSKVALSAERKAELSRAILEEARAKAAEILKRLPKPRKTPIQLSSIEGMHIPPTTKAQKATLRRSLDNLRRMDLERKKKGNLTLVQSLGSKRLAEDFFSGVIESPTYKPTP